MPSLDVRSPCPNQSELNQTTLIDTMIIFRSFFLLVANASTMSR